VRTNEGEGAFTIVQAITGAVHDHAFDVDGPDDDLTVLVIKVK
jgi:hypothetical protein